MSNLKEFWEAKGKYGILRREDIVPQIKLDLGLFFWERGGKQFAQIPPTNCLDVNFETLVLCAKDLIYGQLNSTKTRYLNARDFLDCLDCLGEEKVKELIKGGN